jgi:hypothetical protein
VNAAQAKNSETPTALLAIGVSWSVKDHAAPRSHFTVDSGWRRRRATVSRMPRESSRLIPATLYIFVKSASLVVGIPQKANGSETRPRRVGSAP